MRVYVCRGRGIDEYEDEDGTVVDGIDGTVGVKFV